MEYVKRGANCCIRQQNRCLCAACEILQKYKNTLLFQLKFIIIYSILRMKLKTSLAAYFAGLC